MPGEDAPKMNRANIRSGKMGARATDGPAITKIIVDIIIAFFRPRLSEIAPSNGLPTKIPSMYMAWTDEAQNVSPQTRFHSVTMVESNSEVSNSTESQVSISGLNRPEVL